MGVFILFGTFATLILCAIWGVSGQITGSLFVIGIMLTFMFGLEG